MYTHTHIYIHIYLFAFLLSIVIIWSKIGYSQTVGLERERQSVSSILVGLKGSNLTWPTWPSIPRLTAGAPLEAEGS